MREEGKHDDVDVTELLADHVGPVQEGDAAQRAHGHRDACGHGVSRVKPGSGRTGKPGFGPAPDARAHRAGSWGRPAP